ncbi:flagellar hook-basal body complex protein FliE [Ruminococcaceae bacterium OttesenSCG-928-O06]|nr:flagellar hook-basal body complex protein FliE [Ruminococcaceae bacterium OttesenSCG-928-O06]
MSNFIVPISSLPTISSITEPKAKQNTQSAADALSPFANILQDAVQNMAASGEISQDSMYNLAVGQSDDLHTGAIDMVKYNTAVSFTSGVASSIVRAYNELMRMSI